MGSGNELTVLCWDLLPSPPPTLLRSADTKVILGLAILLDLKFPVFIWLSASFKASPGFKLPPSLLPRNAGL